MATATALESLLDAARERGRRPFQTIPLKDCVGRVASSSIPAVIEEGRRLETRHVLAIAALGLPRVSVRLRPRVAFLTIGTGLVDFERRPDAGQTRNALAPFLSAELERLGCQLVAQGVVGDDEGVLGERVEELLDQDLDLILTTGGLSGPVPKTIAKLAGELFFKSAEAAGGRFGHGPLFVGLPGKPEAAVAGLKAYVEPVLRWMLGEPDRA